MKLPEFSVRKPVATTMFYLALVVLSVVALTKLSLDIMPEMTFPAITITTIYQGAGPEDIENQVTKRIESAVGVVPDLKEIKSNSVENMSIVTLLFNWGTNIDEVTNDVRSRLEFAKKFLPSEAETPTLLKFDLSQMPIMFLTVSARQNYGRLTTLLNDNVAEPLKRVKGIGNVIVFGGPERQIRVDIDRQRILAYNLDLNQITQALASHNITTPAGDINIGGQSFFLRVPAEFTDIDEIRKTLVGSFQGRPIYLEDVADVNDDFAEPLMITRQEKDRSALVIVQKRSGANTVKVADGVLESLKKIQKTLPNDVKILVAMNMSDSVKKTIQSLSNSVLFGGVLVVLVTYLFLFNFRTSFIILVNIPVSLIVAFLFLYLMGYTINIMSLSSLAIAIGMVVDNSIVILENITRRRRELGEDHKESAIRGASEVGMAVSASTFTTVVVFLPLIFTKGLTGIMFKQLGSVIAITLVVSLAISLTLSPMIASFIGKDSKEKKKFAWQLKMEAFFEGIISRLNASVQVLLSYCLSNRRKTIIVSALIFFLSLGLIKFIGTEFFPEQDSEFIQAYIKLPVNTPVGESDAFALKMINEADKILGSEREIIFTKTGQSPFGGGGFEDEGSHIIEFSARLIDKRKRRSDKELAESLRKKFKQFPGPWEVDFKTGDPMSQRFSGSGKPVSVEIMGYDLTETEILAERVKNIMENTKGMVDVSMSRERGKMEYQLMIDRPKLAALGIPPSFVANTLNTAFGGKTATRFREGKDEYDVFVRLKPGNREDIKDVLNLSVRSPDGRTFLMRDLVELKLGQGPLSIARKDQQRFLTVGGNIFGRNLGQVAAEVETEIKKIPLSAGVTIEMAGSVKDQREAFVDLMIAFLLGAMLTYMVMAAQFESFRDPFIIMFAVPFAIVGVLWALFLTGQTLNVSSFIGLVMLVGIVLNNAIVFIDYTIQQRAEGKAVREALLESARIRLRPILMTTVTTICGMLPMVFSRGQGSEVWKPLAVAVIGGLTVSTFITLLLVPVLYMIFEERKEKKLRV